MSTIIKARSPYHIRLQNLVSEDALVNLSCQDIEITGFSVDDGGVITAPTAKIKDGQTAITIDSTSPASFDRSDVTVPRVLYCTFTVPSGYKNSTDTITCSTTAIQSSQPVVLQCKTMRITNTDITSQTFEFTNCGNNEETVSIGAGSYSDVCVYPLSDITSQSGTSNYEVHFQSYGCTTNSNNYISANNFYGPFLVRQDAIDAEATDDANHPLYQGRLYFKDAQPQTGTDGFKTGTVLFKNTDNTGLLPDGWYGSKDILPDLVTLQPFQVRLVDSIIVEGGMLINGTLL